MNEYLQRINELAKKAKHSELTSDELKEQSILRQLYLQRFREHAYGIISNIKVYDLDGNDLTPPKE